MRVKGAIKAAVGIIGGMVFHASQVESPSAGECCNLATDPAPISEIAPVAVECSMARCVRWLNLRASIRAVNRMMQIDRITRPDLLTTEVARHSSMPSILPSDLGSGICLTLPSFGSM